jgi:tetratricopeptide (TPR) repeat protein
VVAADPGVRSQPDWQKRIRNRVAAVSSLYRDLGVRWRVVRFAEWDPLTQAALDDLRQEFRKHEPAADADVRIAFVSSAIEPQQRSSVVAFCRTVMVVGSESSEERKTALLAHTLAHLFGARDVVGEDHSRMAFDPASAALIRRFHTFDFRKGPADSKEVLSYFAEASHATGNRALARAHIGLGLLLWADGDAQAAMHQFDEAVRADADEPAAHFQRGRLLLQEQKYAEAESEFRVAMRQDKDNALVHDQLGLALSAGGKNDAAIEEFRIAIQLAPQDARAFNDLGMSLARQVGRIDPAIAAFEVALRLQPYSTDAQRNLSSALNLRASYERDVEGMGETAKRHPADPVAHYKYGVALLRRGRFNEAGSEFQTAIRNKRDFAQAHADYAIVLHSTGHFRQAWDEIETSQPLGVHAPATLVESVKARLAGSGTSTPRE